MTNIKKAAMVMLWYLVTIVIFLLTIKYGNLMGVLIIGVFLMIISGLKAVEELK